jgi:hypothetical protein
MGSGRGRERRRQRERREHEDAARRRGGRWTAQMTMYGRRQTSSRSSGEMEPPSLRPYAQAILLLLCRNEDALL